MAPITPMAISSSTATIAGFGALAGAVIGALITQLATRSRERSERRAAQQVDALYALQEAAFNVRQAYARYQLDGDDPKTRAKIDRAFSSLDVQRERVWNDLPRFRLRDWEQVAKRRFLDDGPYEAENEAWSALHRAVGQAIKTW